MPTLADNAPKRNVRIRRRRTDKPITSQSGDGACRRAIQASQDDFRTPTQRQRAKAGRKSAEIKNRRSEAWWRKRFLVPGYVFFYRNFLSRCIRARLSPTEWAVLDFIFDRTLGWDKEWERITVTQFLHGSKRDSNGFQAFCGTGLKSETTLRKTLRYLEDVGLIETRQNADGAYSYALMRLDRLVPIIEEMNLPQDAKINYRARWPGRDDFIVIRSNIV